MYVPQRHLIRTDNFGNKHEPAASTSLSTATKQEKKEQNISIIRICNTYIHNMYYKPGPMAKKKKKKKKTHTPYSCLSRPCVMSITKMVSSLRYDRRAISQYYDDKYVLCL